MAEHLEGVEPPVDPTPYAQETYPMTVASSSPAVTLGPAKAVTAAIAGGVVSALAAAATGLTDGELSPLEWVLIASAFIVGTGITGGATFAKSTSVTVN